MKNIFQKFRWVFSPIMIGVALGLFLIQFNFDLFKKEQEQIVLGEDISAKEQVQEEIVFYGKIRHFSTSGSMKFYYADDIEREKLSNGDSSWFWAYMSYNDVDYVGTAEDNSIFKITGTKASDDCGYIDDATCLEAINVVKIEAVK